MRDIEAIVADLLAATTVPEVDSAVRELVEEHGAVWRPVGDRETNFGTIQISTDPANALIERVTNAIDALLEKGHLQHRYGEFRSPRPASSPAANRIITAWGACSRRVGMCAAARAT